MPENPVRYEKSDAHAAGVIGFASALIALVLVLMLCLVWLFDLFRASARRDDPALPTLAAAERVRLPRDLSQIPPPVLQQHESTDLKRFRDAEDSRLNNYGWIDAKSGVVHIPIADAMKMLADPKIARANGIRTEPSQRRGTP